LMDVNLGKFKSSDRYNEDLQQVLDFIQAQEALLLFTNQETLDMIISQVQKDLKEQYDQDMLKLEDRISTKDLTDQHLRAKQMALVKLAETFSARKWILNEVTYDLRKTKIEREIDDSLPKYLEANEKRVLIYVGSVMEELLQKLKVKISAISTPQEEEILQSILDEYEGETFREFDRLVDKWSDLSSYRQGKERFKKEVDEQIELMKQKNFRILSEFHFEALVCAKELIKHEQNCRFCMIKISERHLEKTFQRIAQECMKKGAAGAGPVHASQEHTQHKIIDHWFSKELADERAAIRAQRSNPLLFIPAIAISTLLVWALLRFSGLRDYFAIRWEAFLEWLKHKLGGSPRVEQFITWMDKETQAVRASLFFDVMLGIGLLKTIVFIFNI